MPHQFPFDSFQRLALGRLPPDIKIVRLKYSNEAYLVYTRLPVLWSRIINLMQTQDQLIEEMREIMATWRLEVEFLERQKRRINYAGKRGF